MLLSAPMKQTLACLALVAAFAAAGLAQVLSAPASGDAPTEWVASR